MFRYLAPGGFAGVDQISTAVVPLVAHHYVAGEDRGIVGCVIGTFHSIMVGASPIWVFFVMTAIRGA